MAGGRIEGAGLRGVMRLASVEDHLAHVLHHCESDEPAGVWTGLACQDHGLALGGDVDNATLRRLSAHGQIADLIWEPRGELVAEHGQLRQAAIQAAQDGKPKTAEQLWQQVQAIWSVAWSVNYAALKFLQDAGLSRFSPVRPQRWVAASFEHRDRRDLRDGEPPAQRRPVGGMSVRRFVIAGVPSRYGASLGCNGRRRRVSRREHVLRPWWHVDSRVRIGPWLLMYSLSSLYWRFLLGM
jgi:hypothetical protein